MYSKVLNFTAQQAAPLSASTSVEGLRATALWFQALLMQSWLHPVRALIEEQELRTGTLQGLSVSASSQLYGAAQAARVLIQQQMKVEAIRRHNLGALLDPHMTFADAIQVLANRDVFYEVASLAETSPHEFNTTVSVDRTYLGDLMQQACNGYLRSAAIVVDLLSVASGWTAHLQDRSSFRSYVQRTNDEVKVFAGQFNSPCAKAALELRTFLDTSWKKGDGNILFQN